MSVMPRMQINLKRTYLDYVDCVDMSLEIFQNEGYSYKTCQVSVSIYLCCFSYYHFFVLEVQRELMRVQFLLRLMI